MNTYREPAWAAFCPFGSPRPFIHVGSVRRTRKEVHECIGAGWARAGDVPAQGWKRAYRAGWRAVRVFIDVAPCSVPFAKEE